MSELMYYQFVCVDCTRTCNLYECMDWSEDPADQCSGCLDGNHSCCGNKNGSVPLFDAMNRVWVYDPDECRQRFPSNCFPPFCAWRVMERAVEERYSVEVGQYVMVGYDSIPYFTVGDDVMELSLRKEEEGWSYHAVFHHDHRSSCLTYAVETIEDGIEIQWMSPIAPPSSFRPTFTMHPVRGVEVYDPHGVIDYAQDGRCAGPAFIAQPLITFWNNAIERVQFSYEAYDHPALQEDDTLLLFEQSYTFAFSDVPYTVRYLLRYTASCWKPLITVQLCGREFLGYTYEWKDIEPSMDSSSMVLSDLSSAMKVLVLS
jgi:hypothetical protein